LLGSTIILPLLNGISHIDFLKNKYGKKNILGGAAHIAAVLNSDGKIKQLNPIQVLTVGDLEISTSSVSNAFVEVCKSAIFKIIHTETIEQAMWDKWTFLATLAGSTILFRNGVGAITETFLGSNLMLRMYEECLSIASAENHKVGEKAKDKAIAILMKQGSDFTSSMYRDLLMNKPTEHDQIIGDLIDRAKKIQFRRSTSFICVRKYCCRKIKIQNTIEKFCLILKLLLESISSV
jgi:2-dehydropantoate 2-reductase